MPVVAALDGTKAKAEVELATTFAPGDNFRILASFETDAQIKTLNDTTDVPTNKGGTAATNRFVGALGDQISVWRRVHVEQDMMAATKGDNKTEVTVTNVPTPVGGAYILAGALNIGANSDYENGIMTIGTNHYNISSNTANTVTVTTIGTAPAPQQYDIMNVYDDDWDWDAVTHNPVTRVSTQNEGYMYGYMSATSTRRDLNRYADAYIAPEYGALSAFASNDVPAATHIAANTGVAIRAAVATRRGRNWGLLGPTPMPDHYETDLFWNVYVSTAFQYTTDRDADPNTEAATWGVTDQVDGSVSLVFLETIRDTWDNGVRGTIASIDDFRARVTAHEVGHQFGFPDTGAGYPDPDTHLMQSNVTATAVDDFYFTAGNVAVMRGRVRSPGETGSGLLVAPTEGPHDPNATVPTDTELAPVLEQAIQNWISAGITADQVTQLQSVAVSFADLQGSVLGDYSGGAITLDVDGAGYGWYVDLTPAESEEYELGSDGQLLAISGSGAAGQMDLVTVLTHEFGHVLGLYDNYENVGSAMYSTLDSGIRRLAPSLTS